MKMGEIRMDCPCPKTKCERHKDCDPCRKYHAEKGKLPYCERDLKKNRSRHRDRK